MELRAWNVKDMPRASIEVEKLFAAAAAKQNSHDDQAQKDYNEAKKGSTMSSGQEQ